MATVRGMTPEAIRALLKREIGDYGSTLSYAQQALANSQALAKAVSEFESKLDALPDELEINDEQLKVLEDKISGLKDELEQNSKDLAALDDLTTTLREASDALDSALGELKVSEGMRRPGNLVWNPAAKEGMLGWYFDGVKAEYRDSGGYLADRELVELSWPEEGKGYGGALYIGMEDYSHQFEVPSTGQEYLVSLYVKSSVSLPEGALGILTAGSDSLVSSPYIYAYRWTKIQGVCKELYDNGGRSFFAVAFNTEIPENAVWQICNPSVVEMAGDVLVVDGSISADKIAANAVTTTKLAADSVVAGKIAANSVNTRELIAGSVKSDQIYANAVTTAKIAANAVTANEIAANAVTANEIAANAVTSAKIFAGAITTDKLSANAVTAEKVAANSIGTRELIISPGNLFPDPNFTDPSWGNKANGSGIVLTANGTQNGVYYQPNGMQDESMLVEPGGIYRLTARCRFGETTGVTYVDIYCRYKRDDGKAQIAVIGKIPRESQANYTYGTVSTNLTFPSDMDDGRCTIGFYVQKEHPNGNVEIQNVRIVRAADAALIVQGAIKADHISAGSLTSDKMQIADGFVTNAMIANATIEAAKIASISADQITAGTLHVDRIRANSITAHKINDRIFSYPGSNLMPMDPLTGNPEWFNRGSNFRNELVYILDFNRDWTDTFAASGGSDGIKITRENIPLIDLTQTAGNTSENAYVSVDPSLEYEFSYVTSAPLASSLYIELRDQDNRHAVASGGLTDGAIILGMPFEYNSSTYLVQDYRNSAPDGYYRTSVDNTTPFNEGEDFVLPGQMTLPANAKYVERYKIRVKLRPEVTKVKLGSIYAFHRNGAKRNAGEYVVIGDIRMTPYQVDQAQVDAVQNKQLADLAEVDRQLQSNLTQIADMQSDMDRAIAGLETRADLGVLVVDPNSPPRPGSLIDVDYQIIDEDSNLAITSYNGTVTLYQAGNWVGSASIHAGDKSAVTHFPTKQGDGSSFTWNTNTAYGASVMYKKSGGSFLYQDFQARAGRMSANTWTRVNWTRYGDGSMVSTWQGSSEVRRVRMVMHVDWTGVPYLPTFEGRIRTSAGGIYGHVSYVNWGPLIGSTRKTMTIRGEFSVSVNETFWVELRTNASVAGERYFAPSSIMSHVVTY